MSDHPAYPPLLDGVAWLNRRHRASEFEQVLEPTRRLAQRVHAEDGYD